MTGTTTQFAITGVPNTSAAGAVQQLTITAEDAVGDTDTSFNGLVIYTSSDPNAVLPYQLTLSNGTGTLSVTFATAGTQTVTATDSTDPTVTSTSSGVVVTPGPAVQLVLSAPTTVMAGNFETVNLTAEDTYGNVVAGDTDTIDLTSTDSAATLPSSVTLVGGVGTAGVTYATPGVQSITAADATQVRVTGATVGTAVGQIIQGFVYLNPSAGAAYSGGDTMLPGRTVFVDLNGDGKFEAGEPTDVTNNNGQFSFPGYAAGVANVLEDTTQDAGNQIVVDQTSVAGNGGIAIGVVPISPVAPVPVVPDPFGAGTAAGADAVYIQALYPAVLGRDGSSAEIAAWVQVMQGGTSMAQVAQLAVNSIEHRQDEVAYFDQHFLGQTPDPNAQSYVDSLLSGTMNEMQVVEAIIDSPAYQAGLADPTAFVVSLYSNVVGSQPDAPGLAAWMSLLNSGMSRAQIAAASVQSVQSIDRIVDSFYTAYFHRLPDPLSQGGINFLDSGGSPSALEVYCLTTPEFQALAGTNAPAVTVAPSGAAYVPGDTWYSANLVDAQIASLVQNDMMADDQLTWSDMLSLFTAVEADGTVSADEYQDLQTIVGNTSVIVMSPAVRSLTAKAVGDSLANAEYQGRPLGDLIPGAPASQLETLVDKWFLGLDTPAIPADLTYGVPGGSTFAASSPIGYTQVDQGSLGDCYTMSSLASIALHDPQAIANMIQYLGDNVYSVEFYRKVDGVRTPDFVTVDMSLPENSDNEFEYADGFADFSANNNILWGALIEKAYAQWSAEGFNTQLGQADFVNSYASIGGGGFAQDTLNQFLGSTQYTKDTPENLTYAEITGAFDAGSNVVFETVGGSGSSVMPSDARLVSGHDYAMVAYDVPDQTITLFNPWGITSESVTGMPAYVTLTVGDLSSSNFSDIDYLSTSVI